METSIKNKERKDMFEAVAVDVATTDASRVLCVCSTDALQTNVSRLPGVYPVLADGVDHTDVSRLPCERLADAFTTDIRRRPGKRLAVAFVSKANNSSYLSGRTSECSNQVVLVKELR